MSSLAATTTNATDLASRLLKVGLQAIGRSLDDFLARATKSRLSPVQILEEIARLEEIDKSWRSQESRRQRARIGRFKPIADFDWNWPKKIERDLIERALALEFIREGRNLALIGTNGLGKTMIARNIAHTPPTSSTKSSTDAMSVPAQKTSPAAPSSSPPTSPSATGTPSFPTRPPSPHSSTSSRITPT